jgi:hypothetical protein
MLKLLLWLILFLLCWPVAILALVLWPLVWLLSLPFRLVSADPAAANADYEAPFLRAHFCRRIDFQSTVTRALLPVRRSLWKEP